MSPLLSIRSHGAGQLPRAIVGTAQP